MYLTNGRTPICEYRNAEPVAQWGQASSSCEVHATWYMLHGTCKLFTQRTSQIPAQASGQAQMPDTAQSAQQALLELALLRQHIKNLQQAEQQQL